MPLLFERDLKPAGADAHDIWLRICDPVKGGESYSHIGTLHAPKAANASARAIPFDTLNQVEFRSLVDRLKREIQRRARIITPAPRATRTNNTTPTVAPAIETSRETRTSSAAMLSEPPADAFAAYRASILTDKTQTELASLLTQQFHRPVTQGQVSRWLKQVAKWIEAGNVLPNLEPAKRPVSMDPLAIDMGERQDHRTKRQRPTKK